MQTDTITRDSQQTPSLELHQIGGGSCGLCAGLSGTRVVHSDELLQGRRELFIIHDGGVYRLLRTRNNKLMLQK